MPIHSIQWQLKQTPTLLLSKSIGAELIHKTQVFSITMLLLHVLLIKQLGKQKLAETRMISKLNCNQHGKQSQTLMFLVSPKMEDQSWHLTTRGPQLILTVKSMFAMVWRLVATTCMYQPSSIHISRDVLVKVVPQNFIKDALLTQDCVTLSILWVLFHLLHQFQC